MNKVLICIAEFYPLQNASANCVINICHELKKLDESLQFDVLCLKSNPADFDEEYFDCFSIHRIYVRGEIGKQAFFEYAKELPFPKERKYFFLIAKALYRIRQRVSKHPWRVLYKTFLRKIEELNHNNRYKIIMPVSGNFSTSYACAKYKKRFPNQSVIAYWLDPLIMNPLFSNKDPRSLKNDNEFIQRYSDRMIVTPVIYNHLENKRGVFPAEFPSFFEDEHYTNDPHNIVFDSEKHNLLYTGTFYKDIRNPELLIQIIAALPDKVVLHICGIVGESFLKKHQDLISKGRIVLHGNVSHQILYNAIIDCDYLVNYGNLTEFLLPSKLISYISTGKPIINVYQINNCPSFDYLKQYQPYLNLYARDNSKENSRTLMSFISSNSCCLDRDTIFEKYKECTKKYISERIFLPAIKELLET